MMVIGLTGSIAMGKSEAAKYLSSLGFPVFDSDAEVHLLYDSKQGADLIRPYVPEAVVDEKVDRQKLAGVALKDAPLLAAMSEKVHAEIKRRRESFLAKARASKAKAAILDIPLLYETSAEKQVDKVIVVSADAQIQIARAMARPGMTQERLNTILSRQLPDTEKRARADAVIDNSSTLQQMQKSLHALIVKWGLLDHA